MTKLSIEQIEERVTRAMHAYLRALDRGDIDQKTYDAGIKELTEWSIAKMMQLPRDDGIKALQRLLWDLEGSRK